MANQPIPVAPVVKGVRARRARRARRDRRIASFVVVAATIFIVVLAVRHHGSATVPATVPAPSNVPCAAPGAAGDPHVADAAAPHGVFAFGDWGDAPAQAALVDRYLLNNPDICGATMGFQWNEIDRGPGAQPRYNWSIVEDQIAPWAEAGKIVNLLFSGTGEGASKSPDDTPRYVLDQVKLISCSTARPTPVLWQPGYENNWKAFIAAAVEHFAGDANVGYMRFGLGMGAEGVLWPEQISRPACGALWEAVGYRADWPAYVRQMIAFMGSLHSKRQLVIGLSDQTNLPPAAEEASEAAARGIGFGVESLTGADAADILADRPCATANWCQVFSRYAGKVPLYVQDLSATTPVSGAPGEGLLPPLLEAALRIRVQILEVYVADLLFTFDPNLKGYSRYHESYAAAVAATATVLGTHDGVAPAR